MSQIKAFLADVLGDKWPGVVYCGCAGALGVASGFALFSYLWYAGGHAHPLRLVIGLMVAAMMSFVFESLREHIRFATEGASEHHQTHRLTWGGWLGTVMMLFAFELFVVSWHSLPEMQSAQFTELAKAISGIENAPPWFSLLGLVVIWICVGGGLAACLSQDIGTQEGLWHVKAGKGALQGAFWGVVLPPCIVLGMVLGVRLLLALGMMAFQPELWRKHLDNLIGMAPHVFIKWPLWALRHIDDLASIFGPVRPMLLIGVLLGFLAYYTSNEKKPAPVHWVAIALALTVIWPLLVNVLDLLMLLGLATLIWVIPAIVLGAIAPLLARPSENRRIWGLSAVGAALLLLGVTMLRLGWLPQHGLLVIRGLAALLAVGGVLVFALRRVEECWPVLALTTATLVWGVSVLVQPLTFSGVLTKFHVISSAPAAVDAVPPWWPGRYPFKPPSIDNRDLIWPGGKLPLFPGDLAPWWSVPGAGPAFPGTLTPSPVWPRSKLLDPSTIELLQRSLKLPGQPKPLPEISQEVTEVEQILPQVKANLERWQEQLADAGTKFTVYELSAALDQAHAAYRKLVDEHCTVRRDYHGIGKSSTHHQGDSSHSDGDCETKQKASDHEPTYNMLLSDLKALQVRLDRPKSSQDETHTTADANAAVADHPGASTRILPEQQAGAETGKVEPLAALVAARRRQTLETLGQWVSELTAVEGKLGDAQRTLERAQTDLGARTAIGIMNIVIDELKRRISSATTSLQELQSLTGRHKTDVTELRERSGAAFDNVTTTLEALKKSVDHEYNDAFDEYKRLAAQRLELALACSFAFWTTIGLLIGWSEFLRAGAHHTAGN